VHGENGIEGEERGGENTYLVDVNEVTEEAM